MGCFIYWSLSLWKKAKKRAKVEVEYNNETLGICIGILNEDKDSGYKNMLRCLSLAFEVC